MLGIQIHSLSILKPPLDSSMSPAPIENNLLLMPNQSAPMPTPNRYADLYSYDSEYEPAFEEMVDSKTLKPINKYYVVPLSKTPIGTPHKGIK